MAVSMKQAVAATGKLKDMLTPATKGKNGLTAAEVAAVDELVALNAEVVAFAAKAERYETLKKQLQAVANDKFDHAVPAVLVGNVGEVEFSKTSTKREIVNMNDLIGTIKAKIGYENLIQLVKISLGDVDKYLNENESAKFIETKDGSRTLKSVRETE